MNERRSERGLARTGLPMDHNGFAIVRRCATGMQQKVSTARSMKLSVAVRDATSESSGKVSVLRTATDVCTVLLASATALALGSRCHRCGGTGSI